MPDPAPRIRSLAALVCLVAPLLLLLLLSSAPTPGAGASPAAVSTAERAPASLWVPWAWSSPRADY